MPNIRGEAPSTASPAVEGRLDRGVSRPAKVLARGFMLIELLIVIAVVGILVAVGVSLYSDSQRPTIELKKDDWECVKSEQRTHLQPMLVGKVTILQPMTSTVCVQYSRRAG